MSTAVSFNGSSFSVPAVGEEDWGGATKVDGLLISLANNALAKSGGTFTLTAEVDFGGTAGLKALSYKSRGTNVSSTGILRLANAESVGWRNAANGADLLLTVTAGDVLQFDGVTLLSASNTVTLTNKKFSDSTCTFVDNGDATKQLAFECSGITTATTRTWTVPDASSTLVGTDTTQTLSNKTLTSPTINGGTIASNPTITVQDSALSIVDNSDATKILQVQCSGITTGTTRTLTVPDANTTIVGTDATQVLTNKDIDGGTASNAKRITFPKDTLANITALTRKEGTVWYATDTDNLYKDDGTSLTEIGSGSGGSINYISNPDAESGVTGWAAYADAAATSPVDGTGGSPTVTITRTTTTPLRGTGSFLLTKDAANRQGEGVSYAFTIDSADKAKVLNVSFDYEIASGTFASGDSSDVRVFVYDVTNTALIPVSPYTIQGGSSNQWKFQGTFQTASNSTSYRLILHCATTSASAYTFEFDNVVVGPQVMLYGAPVSDWTAYTPSSTQGFGTISSGQFWYRRVGDSIHVMGTFTAGTVTASEARISLPSGLTIDSSKVDASYNVVGNASRGSAAAENLIVLAAPSVAHFNFGRQDATFGGLTVASGSNLISTGNEFSFNAVAPITGWSSTVLMSNDTDTRIVAARIGGDPASASSGNPVILPTAAYDTHSGYNASTGIYTVPVSGFYRVHGAIESVNANVDLSVYVGSSPVIQVGSTDSNGQCSYTGTVQVVAGNTISLRPGGTLDATSASTLHIERLSGPSAIAATETVACSYETNAGQAVGTSTAVFIYEDRKFDTHSAYNTSTGIFTVPVSGKYAVSAQYTLTSVTLSTSQFAQVDIVKNGSQIITGTVVGNGGSPPYAPQIFGTMSCVAGDTLQINAVSSVGGNANTTARLNTMQIYRIGN